MKYFINNKELGFQQANETRYKTIFSTKYFSSSIKN